MNINHDWWLARTARRLPGRRADPELVGLIEGLALRKPRPSLASITRRSAAVAQRQGWTPVSYSTVRGSLPPGSGDARPCPRRCRFTA